MSITLQQALGGLKDLSDERALKGWLDFGITPRGEYWGVPITKMRNYAKSLKKHHDIALELWDCGVHDAMLLSAMIEEPKKVDKAQCIRQVQDICAPDLARMYAEFISSKVSFNKELVVEWCASDDEYTKCTGFHTLCNIAKDKKLNDTMFFMPYIIQIEQECQAERNWVKEVMHWSLFAIGSVNKELHTEAVAAVKKIGKVEVDYGKTSCETVDVLKHLLKSKFNS